MRRLSLPFFAKDDSGMSTVGFVVVFPLVFFTFCFALEQSLHSLRKVQLANAATEVTRFIRLSSNTPPDKNELMQILCDSAVVFKDCPNTVTVELSPIDTDGWTLNADAMQCVDRRGGFIPAEEYVGGISNEMMLLRLCAVFEPVFPGFALTTSMVETIDGDYAILDVSFFTNEPSS